MGNLIRLSLALSALSHESCSGSHLALPLRCGFEVLSLHGGFAETGYAATYHCFKTLHGFLGIAMPDLFLHVRGRQRGQAGTSLTALSGHRLYRLEFLH